MTFLGHSAKFQGSVWLLCADTFNDSQIYLRILPYRGL